MSPRGYPTGVARRERWWLAAVAAAVACTATATAANPPEKAAPTAASGVDVTPQHDHEVVLRLDRRSAALAPFANDAERLGAADRLQYQHRYAEAEALLDLELVGQSVPDPAVLLQRAQLRLAQGRAREALGDCLRAAARIDALAASGCEAQALAALGQRQRARTLIESALQRAQGDAAVTSWAQGIAAELAALDGDIQRAEDGYRRAIALAARAAAAEGAAEGARTMSHFPRVAYARFLIGQRRGAEALRLLATAEDDPTVLRLRRLALESLS